MKIHSITRALAVCALVTTALGSTLKINAATLSTGVGFVTVQDLVITQSNALSFGQSVIGKASTSCVLAVTVYGGATTTAAAATAAINDNITGVGCIPVAGALTNNLAGVYGITGATSQAFNVTVKSATNADFSFTPTAKVGNVAAGLSAAGNVVFADTSQATTTDSAGLAMVVVAGTITIGSANLVANTPYSQNFDIVATY